MFQKATDDELVVKMAAGNDSAFRELFDRHGPKVLGYCCRFLASQERGEDVTQEVWIKVIRSAPSYRAEGKFASWVLSIARTTCLDVFRNKSESMSESSDEDTLANMPDMNQESTEQILLQAEDKKQLQAAIDQLPEQQRVVLVIWMSNDASYETIAQDLDLSVSSVKSLLFRARQSLEATLGHSK